MKYFFSLLFLLSFILSNAQLQKDKVLHFGAGVVIGGVGGYTHIRFLKEIGIGLGQEQLEVV